MKSRITKNWVTFLPEICKGRACLWLERPPEATKLYWEHLIVELITDFGKFDFYEALICELCQLKQGMLE